ncbi:ABC transporter permease [Streptomyces marokkonensis]|uniref:ABC transporter permease n=1 Tax=Streptomyces marokkonensis TaxID=324855 RepID=A0ABP7QWQ5_9ACTN
MLTVALGTLRVRWVSFLGTVVALVLAVAQLTALGVVLTAVAAPPERPPHRFARAPSVVLPVDPRWDSAQHDLGVRSLPEARGLSRRLLREVSATGTTVVDRAFYAQLANGPVKQVGHPWPVAEFGGYALRDGRAPRTGREIVVAADRARTGETVTVLTAAGPGRYTVVGTVAPASWEDAVFFTADEAERLSPRIDALVALGPAERVRAVVEAGDGDGAGAGAEVLTGAARHRADADAGTDREALDNTLTLLPVMAAVAGTTAVFVVASTFAFAVVQRRREIALLRTVGATGRQVRRMVRAEALLVGCLASALGGALGLLGTRPLTGLLVAMDIAPPWFAVELSARRHVLAPLGAAFLTGVLVAYCGAVAAARRASRVRPVEALREGTVDDTAVTPGRAALGIAGLAGGAGVACWIGLVAPRTVLSPTAYVVSLLVPVVAAAVLAPLTVGPVVRVLTWPLRRLPGPAALLVRQSALTSRRRTAATAAPVLLTVGLALSLLTATDSLGTARDHGFRAGIGAPYAVVPDGTPGFSPSVAARVARVDGVRLAAPVLTTVYLPDGDGRLEENDGLAVHPAALRRTTRLKVVHGSLDDLDEHSMAVADRWHMKVGDRVRVLLADGGEVTLRVAATYAALPGEDVAYLPRRLAGTGLFARDGLVRRASLSLAPGTDRAAALAGVRAVLEGSGARLTTRRGLVAAGAAQARRLTETRQRSTAAIVVLFCFVAILNTLLMAASDRRRDLAVLGMTGATPRQVLHFFVAEALLVTAVGVTLALLAGGINLLGLAAALHQLFGTAPIVVPWATVGAVTAVSGFLAVLGTVLPVATALRRRTRALRQVRHDA